MGLEATQWPGLFLRFQVPTTRRRYFKTQSKPHVWKHRNNGATWVRSRSCCSVTQISGANVHLQPIIQRSVRCYMQFFMVSARHNGIHKVVELPTKCN